MENIFTSIISVDIEIDDKFIKTNLTIQAT